MQTTITISDRIFHAAARVNSRYAISGSLFVQGPNGGAIVATDRRILSIRPVELTNTPDTVSTFLLADIIKPSRAVNPKMYDIEIDADAGEATAYKLDRHKNRTGEANTKSKIDATFPPYANVIPQRDESEYAFVALNSELLDCAIRAAQGDDANERMIVLAVPITTHNNQRSMSNKPILVASPYAYGGITVQMPASCTQSPADIMHKAKTLANIESVPVKADTLKRDDIAPITA